MTATTKTAAVLTQLLGVEMTGNLAIVTPGPIDEVAEPLLAMIDKAIELHRQGSTMRAGAMILEVERRLKISEEDRVAAAAAKADWEIALEAALVDMSCDGPARPDNIALPDDIGRYTKAEERALAKAQEKLAKSKDAEARKNAWAEIDKIAAKPAQRLFEHRRKRDTDETTALAIGRGEQVQQTGIRVRILTRQGIQQAFEEGHMTPALGPMTADDLHVTAKAYRDAYEIAEGMTGRSGEGGGGYGAKGPQIRVIEAGEVLAVMRLELTQRQVDVLDRVCGQDMRLREAATILRRGFPSTKNSLIMGLKAATLNLKAARAVKDQGEPTTKARLESARAQVDAAMRAAG